MFWEINCKMAVIGIQTSSCNISWRQGHEALWWSNLFQNTHDIYYIYSITKCSSPPLKGSYFPTLYSNLHYKKYFNVPLINCRSESDFLPNFFNCEISCRRHYIVYTLLYVWPKYLVTNSIIMPYPLACCQLFLQLPTLFVLSL